MKCYVCNETIIKFIGKCCSRQCHNRLINSQRDYKTEYAVKHLKTIEKYNQNPTHCKECDCIIPYEKRHNKFCSHTCSATFTNQHRNLPKDIGLRISKGMEKSKICQLDPNKFSNDFVKVYFRECRKCSKLFCYHKNSFHYCSDECRLNTYENKKQYRSRCRFNLNPIDHHFLYKWDLIKEHGWYAPSNSPKPNLNGVTWDHLYRISDGYENGVSPTIISHPANAEMVLWEENYYRKENQITLEELKYRIKSWDYPR